MKAAARDKTGGGFELTKGVFMAYLILLLHVLLIAGLGLMVLFLRGFVTYMLWIFLGGSAALILSAYVFFRRLRAQGKRLGDVLNSANFRGRPVEISFLGGLASLRVGQPGGRMEELDNAVAIPPLQLEDEDSARTRELTELAKLYKNDLITLDEYNLAKRQLLKTG